MPAEWTVIESDEAAAQEIARRLDLHPIAAKILLNRGIRTVEAAKRYLAPELSDIPDPFILPDMDKAVERIAAAIEHEERIAIFGDYDVDGITGAAMLYLFFRELGITPTLALPNRLEGYGLSESSIRKIKDGGATLLITVDNGIRAADEILLASELGIDTVITDHHEIVDLPKAAAVVNPHRLEDGNPLRNLSGCGVAFMLLMALRKHLRAGGTAKASEPNLRQHLDLVAMGTIADVMPLTGINRTLVKHGLKEIAFSTKPGIRALMDISSTTAESLNPGSVAFRLAPRINAAGRLGTAELSLELMLCQDEFRSVEIARTLDKANRERQDVEQKMLAEAARIVGEGDYAGRSGIVVHSTGWHIGVLGIVAAKLAELTSRPAVVITRDAEPARGSARSIEGINLMEILDECGDLLAGYGGHAMAAGLSIRNENLAEFERRFDSACGKLNIEARVRTLKIDAEISASDVTAKLVDDIAGCQPFGSGNPEPVLAIRDIAVIDKRIVGDSHLKLRLGDGRRQFGAIGFNMAGMMSEISDMVSIAFMPQFNTWNGETAIQLKLKDIKTC